MKRILLAIRMFVGIAAFLMTTAVQVNAAFVLTLDDPATSGVDVIVLDNGPLKVQTNQGLSNQADMNGLPGVVFFSGIVGGSTITITTGVSKQVVGQQPGDEAKMDLNSVHVSGAGTIEIMLTDTDFKLDAQPTDADWLAMIGGTTDGTVTATQTLDRSNNEFGIDGPVVPVPDLPPDLVWVAQGPFSGGAFGGAFANEVSQVVPLGTGRFSLTQWIKIVHTAPGQITSFDAQSTVVPVPDASVAFLLGSAFLIFFGISRRKVK